MTDALNLLIINEIARQVALREPRVTYGVWIPGKGWLGNDSRTKFFADERISVAQSAARLYGGGARVEPYDESLQEMEAIFLERERVQQSQRLMARVARWVKQHGVA